MLSLALSGESAQAAEPSKSSAYFREVAQGGKITGLNFQRELTLPITPGPISATDSSPSVELRGSYAREGWNLLLGNITVPRGTGGSFLVRVPLRGSDTPLNFFAVGPKGEVESARFNLFVSDSAAVVPAPTSPSRFSFSPGISYSSITYRESGVPNFSEIAMTAKLSLSYALQPEKLSLGISAFGTALPLGSNQSGVSARFIGANARLGWNLPYFSSPWSVTLMAGGYYTTMLVQGGNFGFADLMGPQIFVLASRSLSPLYSAGAYTKFAMIGSGLGLAGPKDREIAGGVSLTRMLGGGRPLSLSIDISDLAINVDGVALGDSSFSIGLSLGL